MRLAMVGLLHPRTPAAIALLAAALAAPASAHAAGVVSRQSTGSAPSTHNAGATAPATGRVSGAGAATSSGTPTTTYVAPTPTTTYVPSGGATPVPGTGPGGTATGAPAVPRRPSTLGGQTAPALRGVRTARHRGHGISTLAIVIAALAALLVLGCAAWALARRSAFEPHWWLSLRHAMAEAGFRASATWAEFTDWVRLGH